MIRGRWLFGVVKIILPAMFFCPFVNDPIQSHLLVWRCWARIHPPFQIRPNLMMLIVGRFRLVLSKLILFIEPSVPCCHVLITKGSPRGVIVARTIPHGDGRGLDDPHEHLVFRRSIRPGTIPESVQETRMRLQEKDVYYAQYCGITPLRRILADISSSVTRLHGKSL